MTDLEPIRPDDAAVKNAQGADQDSVLLPRPTTRCRTTVVGLERHRAHAPQQPPRPIAERPSGPRPDRGATWVPGYWDWDSARAEFVWIGGVWQVPPPGLDVGHRPLEARPGRLVSCPGFWSRRRDNGAIPTTYSTANQPAWRSTGPPAGHPDDNPAAAPGPDYFYVPGHYARRGIS